MTERYPKYLPEFIHVMSFQFEVVRSWSFLPQQLSGVAKIFSPRRDSDIDFSERHFEDWRPRPPYKRRRRGYSNSSGGNSSEGGRGSFDRGRNYSHRSGIPLKDIFPCETMVNLSFGRDQQI